MPKVDIWCTSQQLDMAQRCHLRQVADIKGRKKPPSLLLVHTVSGHVQYISTCYQCWNVARTLGPFKQEQKVHALSAAAPPGSLSRASTAVFTSGGSASLASIFPAPPGCLSP